MTITEFLLARRTEATEDELIKDAAWDAVQMGLTFQQRVEWMRVYDKTLHAQSARANTALGNLGWAMLSVIYPAAIRREAAKFADHPDYRQEWKP